MVEKMLTEVIKNRLMAEPANEEVFIVDNPSHNKAYRNKIANLLFEKCQFQSLNFLNSTTLALFSTGRTEFVLFTTEACLLK